MPCYCCGRPTGERYFSGKFPQYSFAYCGYCSALYAKSWTKLGTR